MEGARRCDSHTIHPHDKNMSNAPSQRRLRNPNQREPASRFAALAQEAALCRACPRLAERGAVLGPLNGSLTPRVLFIGEAPGRRGADRTRVPFHGDASGRCFEYLLGSAGLTREEVFITNAVLCCPADDSRNHPPTTAEVRQCGRFLRRTLDLLQPPVVATVGAIALRSLGYLMEHRWHLSEVAGTVIRLPDFLWVPLYHPSPRVLHTVRSQSQQEADFQILARCIQTSGPRRPRAGARPTAI